MLRTVGWDDGERVRSIMYRGAVSEMIVPYGDPALIHARKNVFDIGELNFGALANSLTLGCDCLGEIYYFDAALVDAHGNPYTLKNAICMHEEDFGVLWRHSTGAPARPRCAARAGWSSRRFRPSGTTTTASSGTSTRMATSSARSS